MGFRASFFPQCDANPSVIDEASFLSSLVGSFFLFSVIPFSSVLVFPRKILGTMIDDDSAERDYTFDLNVVNWSIPSHTPRRMACPLL